MTEKEDLSFWERFEFKMNHHGVRNDIEEVPCIDLDKDPKDEKLIKTCISRRSYRKFKNDPIPLNNISNLLAHLHLKKLDGVHINKGIYGSAGSLYPVQAYMYVKPNRLEGIPYGLYYYHPYDHKLVLISDKMNVDLGLYPSGNDVIYDSSAFVIYFIAKMDAITPVYREKARDYVFIEVGLMAQVLEMEATYNNIGLCQIGGFDFQPLCEYFKLENSHVYLHQIVGGMIDDSQTTLESLAKDSESYKSLSNQFKINNLLSKLKKNDIEIFLKDGKLKYKAPKEALNQELRAEIAEHKNELVDYFQQFDIGSADK